MFLNVRNIIILRSFKKLNDKIVESFKILTIINIVYWLKLLLTIKIYNVFTLNLLWLNSTNSLEKQQNELLILSSLIEWLH